ncbi:Uncharacterised protein [Mycolicibacter terrae]|nr:Uncharacterised protein [Mycolicibacter terrae]
MCTPRFLPSYRREAIGSNAVTRANDTVSTTDLLARTLESVRAAYEDIAELAQHQDGLYAVAQTARGTALIHDLRKQLDQLNKILPFKS